MTKMISECYGRERERNTAYKVYRKQIGRKHVRGLLEQETNTLIAEGKLNESLNYNMKKSIGTSQVIAQFCKE